MKRCSICGELKPLSSYYRAGSTARDWFRGDCIPCNLIPCNLAAKAERHRQDPEPSRRRTKQWMEANPDRVAANRRAVRGIGRQEAADRRSHLKRKYGMIPPARSCGILCFCCNNALADFQEKPELLKKAVAYLISHTPGVEEEIQLARRRALSLVG